MERLWRLINKILRDLQYSDKVNNMPHPKELKEVNRIR